MRNLILWIIVGLLAAPLCTAAPQTSGGNGGNKDEQEIRALYDHLAAAFGARNVESIMQSYAPGDELFVFDLLAPGQRVGFNDYKKYYKDFLASLPGPIVKLELRDLSILAEGNLAYSHAIEVITVSSEDGGSTSVIGWRLTHAFRKISGKWLITQEHISMPDESKLPSLMSGDERSATSSLETINRECITYLATYGSGFPAKLNNLGPSAPATPKFANLIDYELASGNKDDYTFIYRAGAAIDGVTPTYAIQANPSTPGRNGKRYFFTDQTTLIRFNTSHPATKADPPLN